MKVNDYVFNIICWFIPMFVVYLQLPMQYAIYTKIAIVFWTSFWFAMLMDSLVTKHINEFKNSSKIKTILMIAAIIIVVIITGIDQ